MKSALALTFHKVNADPAVPKFISNSAADRYTISTGRFEQAVNIIPPERCCTVSEYIEKRAGDWLILTFDDGFLSDFEIVFPILKNKRIKATFFINTGSIDLPGYSNISHLKEMAKAGMEIASHGLTHHYLINMERDEAIREIKESKDRLEKQVGTEVKSFAPVGGHYRKWMKSIAQEAGYRAFATMIPGKTNGGENMVLLHRNHIQSHHDAGYVSRLINGDYGTLLLDRLRYSVLQIPKNILGIQNYDLAKKYLSGILKTP
jgi:peptidoglycan/xylan/chitin deacetylase (PgdA/CDA1 family)